MEPTALSLTEEDLTEVKKDALENLRVYLCEKIIAERHFDHLRAKKILSREDTEEISCRTSSRKRAGKLLDYLQENPKGLDTLVESIRREKTQNFLIQKITDEVLKLRNIKLEHLKGLKCSNCEPFPDGATNSFTRSNSNETNFSEKRRTSTIMYHPEGESSTAPFFSTDSSLNLPVLELLYPSFLTGSFFTWWLWVPNRAKVEAFCSSKQVTKPAQLQRQRSGIHT
ncbi:B-cell lymphoma/leukemia 10 isoform X2 [Pteronotus mesoamericanus]|uniref:B-cell lymphoma/leukemia 10 isoform X2 n=1 Tax=Pteronotus mesoamericanus TaxID=1884717 RepID=UPI0023ED91CC|nr:B-cell lymphoma/leukemia 10 isoform X2 [Pteronotus parnellii mesoamericanus]